MDKLKYMILSVWLFSMGGCTSEEMMPGDKVKDAEVRLSASIAGSAISTRAGDESYLNTTFKEGDQIRLVNTVFFSEPEFDKAQAFVYKEGDMDGNDYPFESLGDSETTGGGESGDEQDPVSWEDFKPTSLAYVFEAAYVPNRPSSIEEGNDSYLPVIPRDQGADDGVGFKNADLLLAHHRMLLDEKYKDIRLNFHHVFVMVKAEIIVPIGLGGLKEDALQSATLKNVQTEYELKYSETITNDGLRTVVGKGDPTDVTMWKQSSLKSGDQQTYVFLAIIPLPENNLIKDRDFLHFKVESSNGSINTYRFLPEKAIPLKQSCITTLKLKLSEDGNIAIPLSAEIKDWNNATGSANLHPETEIPDGGEPDNPDNPDSNDNEDKVEEEGGEI